MTPGDKLENDSQGAGTSGQPDHGNNSLHHVGQDGFPSSSGRDPQPGCNNMISTAVAAGTAHAERPRNSLDGVSNGATRYVTAEEAELVLKNDPASGGNAEGFFTEDDHALANSGGMGGQMGGNPNGLSHRKAFPDYTPTFAQKHRTAIAGLKGLVIAAVGYGLTESIAYNAALYHELGKLTQHHSTDNPDGYQDRLPLFDAFGGNDAVLAISLLAATTLLLASVYAGHRHYKNAYNTGIIAENKAFAYQKWAIVCLGLAAGYAFGMGVMSNAFGVQTDSFSELGHLKGPVEKTAFFALYGAALMAMVTIYRHISRVEEQWKSNKPYIILDRDSSGAITGQHSGGDGRTPGRAMGGSLWFI
jgi:hypothetical protein